MRPAIIRDRERTRTVKDQRGAEIFQERIDARIARRTNEHVNAVVRCVYSGFNVDAVNTKKPPCGILQLITHGCNHTAVRRKPVTIYGKRKPLPSNLDPRKVRARCGPALAAAEKQ